MNQNLFLKLAAISGVLAVVLGAFGAHSLAGILAEKQLDTFKTGSQYHFYHTLALLGVAILLRNKPEHKYLKWAARFFLIGILLFSGSLYLLACKDIFQLGAMTKIIGPVTPIGGLCFIIGWIMLALYKEKV